MARPAMPSTAPTCRTSDKVANGCRSGRIDAAEHHQGVGRVQDSGHETGECERQQRDCHRSQGDRRRDGVEPREQRRAYRPDPAEPSVVRQPAGELSTERHPDGGQQQHDAGLAWGESARPLEQQGHKEGAAAMESCITAPPPPRVPVPEHADVQRGTVCPAYAVADSAGADQGSRRGERHDRGDPCTSDSCPLRSAPIVSSAMVTAVLSSITCAKPTPRWRLSGLLRCRDHAGPSIG